MSNRRGPNYVLMAVGLILSAGFVAILAVGFQFNPFALPDAMLNKPAPNFSLVDLDGNAVKLDDSKVSRWYSTSGQRGASPVSVNIRCF